MQSPKYEVVEDAQGAPLVIRDVGPWSVYPTVTNGAEAVVEELAAKGLLPEGRRLFYFDSEGERGELVVVKGRFAGFR